MKLIENTGLVKAMPFVEYIPFVTIKVKDVLIGLTET